MLYMSYIWYIFTYNLKTKVMKTEKQVWYWVTGNAKKGFKVVTKRPRTKHVEEPHRTERGAYLWIANFYSQNA